MISSILFEMTTESARLSPRINRCNGSASPEQGSPRNNNEQSLHIVVEPQPDGHMNMIHLVSPLNGQVFSSYLAENGACIEIQPGVVFRVPFPQEHGYRTFPPQQFPQQPPFPPNVVPCGIQMPGNLFPPRVGSAPRGVSIPRGTNPVDYFPSANCPVHGSPNASNGFQQSTGEDNRLERRREKLQRKWREKQPSGCSCQLYDQNNQTSKMASNSKGRREMKMNGPPSSAVDTNPTENGDTNEVDGKETDEDIPILAPPKATVVDARTIQISWADCVANNSHLSECAFELDLASKGGGFKQVYSGSDVEHVADGLCPATEYTFRLRVIVDGKRGRYSETSSTSTPSTTPNAPGLPKITQKTKTSLVIKWSAPYDGGSVITAYSLQWNGGKPQAEFEEVYNGPQRQHKLSHKLPPLTPCRFRLMAANENGNSDFSPVLECMTSGCPPDAPDAPQLVKATTTTLSLHWAQPKDNGAPITEYRLEKNDEQSGYGFKPVYCDDKMEFTCRDLSRDTAYKFRLSATNVSGSSKYSPTVSYKTLPEAPGKMEKPRLVGKAKTHTFTVTWDPPKDTGGPEIESYILEICDAKVGEMTEAYRGIKPEFAVSGLQPGHTYKVRVFSVGCGGRSMPSAVAHITTMPVCPFKPEPPRISTRLKQEPTSLHLEWDSPKNDGGSQITSYTLRMRWPSSEEREDEDVYEGPRRQCTINGLQPGEKYLLKLLATNKAGLSPWSEFSELHTAPGPPDAPEIPSCICKSPSHIRLEWTEPITHGTPVTGYIVEQLHDESFTKVYEGIHMHCEVKKGLQPATYYYFRVQALSNAGPSHYSAVCSVETLPASPSTITFFKVVDQTSSSALLQWKHPHDNGANITHYVLEVAGATTFTITVPIAANSDCHDDHADDEDGMSVDDDVSSHYCCHDDDRSKTSVESRSHEFMEHEVTGLLADTAYRIRAQAVNRIGSGPFSHPAQFVTKELPPSPPSLELISSSHQSLKLKWGESVSPRRNNLGLNFTLQMKNKSGSFSTIFTGMAQSFSVTKLKELSSYTFRISARNDAGDGSFSEPKTFYTKAQPPQVVKDLVWKRLSPSSAKISWQSSDVIKDDDVINYIVQRLRVDHTKEFAEVYNGPNSEVIFDDLVPDQDYQLRVCALRLIADSLRTITPNAPSSIKGQFSSTLRIKIPAEAAVDDLRQAANAEQTKEDVKVREMSDTQVSLLILGFFLVIGIICALSVWFFMGEIKF